MKRIAITSEKCPNFIGCWELENHGICEDIIDFFDKNKELQAPGATATGVKPLKKKLPISE